MLLLEGTLRLKLFLPLSFEAPHHQAILGLDGLVLPLGALSFVTRSLHALVPESVRS